MIADDRLWRAVEGHGPKVIFLWLLGLVTVMVLPIFVPSDWDLQLLIAADVIALVALFIFIWVQSFIRELFSQWAEGATGFYSPAVVKTLLLGNSAILIAAVSSCAAVLTFDLAMKFQIYNPFEQAFSLHQSFLFFADQALKGLLFDLSNVFNLNIQSVLHVDARTFIAFGILLVLYRLMMAYFTVNIVISSWRRLFG